MVILTEQIEIPAPYEKMEAWTANFEEEFVKWSPYHIECNLYDGNYRAGSKIRFREIVMGMDYDVTGAITECEQDENHFRIVFQSRATRRQLLLPLRESEQRQVAIFLIQRLSA